MLDELGLAAALTELAGRYDGHGLDVSVETDRLDDLDPQLAAAAYGIASEATTNVARHAGANHCWITAVRHIDGYLVLTVEDDGTGVDDRSRARGRQPVDARAGGRAGRHPPGRTPRGRRHPGAAPPSAHGAARGAPDRGRSGSPIVDDHPVFRLGMVGLLGSLNGIEVVAQAASAAEAAAASTSRSTWC